MSDERLVISATEAAGLLNMSQAKVLELLDAGEIPAYRDGRNWKIPSKSLEGYVLERAMTEAKARREVRKEMIE